MKGFLHSWKSVSDGSCNQARRKSRPVMAIGILAVAALFAGCTTPFSIGLRGEIPTGGITGTSSVFIETLPDRLWLTGSYDIRDGSLTIDVFAPDGSARFSREFEAIAQGQIREELQPMIGEWTISVSSATGEGSYDVRLQY